MDSPLSCYCSKCHELYSSPSSHSPHLLHIISLPPSLLSKFIFISLIGQGTYGTVFKVRERSNEISIENSMEPSAERSINHSNKKGKHHEYALKLLSFIEQDENPEFFIMKQLYHKNIIKSFKTIRNLDEGYEAIVTELCETDLDSLIKNKTLSDDTIFKFATEIVSGVNYLHNEIKPPIIHRDLKTANILIKENTIKITDFGIARLKKTNMAENWSMTKEVGGTPNYMPPEMLRGIDKNDGKYNEKTDVFGVGIILHQLASGGRHPFDRKKKDGSTIRENILDGQLNIDEKIKLNPTLHEIISGCLNPDVTHRLTIHQVLSKLTSNPFSPIKQLPEFLLPKTTTDMTLVGDYLIFNEISPEAIYLAQKLTDLSSNKPKKYAVFMYPLSISDQLLDKASKDFRFHRNLVRLEDLVITQNFIYKFFIFFEMNLKKMISLNKLTSPEKLKIIRILIETVDFLHDQGVTHGQLSPSNIFFDEEGVVKIGGSSCLSDYNKDLVKEQVASLFVYKAPESFEDKLDLKSDLFSLGVIFFELFHKHPPYQAKYLKGMLECYAKEEEIEFGEGVELEDRLKELIRRMLRIDSEGRIGVKEVRKVLEELGV